MFLGAKIMKLSTLAIAFTLLSPMFILGCDNVSGTSDTMMSADFKNLSECLKSIQSDSGQSLDIITDEPDEVSGFLSNGEGFACNKEESGTKGIYFNGWYTVK